MKLNKANSIIPADTNVVVQVINEVQEEEGVIINTQVNRNIKSVGLYKGIVLKIAPKAVEKGHAQGLKVEDIVLFSRFAGHHVAVESNFMYKVVPGSMLMGIMENKEDYLKIKPLANRLLVEVEPVDVTVGGVVLGDIDANDPTLEDLDYGRVLAYGPECQHDYGGKLLAFTPYVGETASRAKSGEHKELRLINELDILFSVEE